MPLLAENTIHDRKPVELFAEGHAPAADRRVSPMARVQVSLLTYNILYGRRWPLALELIRRHPADITCLQEVVEDAHPDPELTTVSTVRRDLDLPHGLAWLWNRPPRRIGNMTLVRSGRIIGERILHERLSEPYGCATGIVLRGARLTVANIHMTHMLGPAPLAFPISEMYRLREALHLTRTYRSAGAPVVALGDFNTFWPAPACWAMRRHWRDARRETGGRHAGTRPTYGLPFVIDHVFIRGDARVKEYRVLDGPGSDHRAIWTVLDVPAAGG
jgi:endonuclease/exonuclease/phosphatase family metal-dependent hydrolase